MPEYKYLSIVVNKFDLPFGIKLARVDPDLMDTNLVDKTIEKISENIKEYDATFSLENHDSLLSRFQDGEETG